MEISGYFRIFGIFGSVARVGPGAMVGFVTGLDPLQPMVEGLLGLSEARERGGAFRRAKAGPGAKVGPGPIYGPTKASKDPYGTGPDLQSTPHRLEDSHLS